MVDDVRLWGDVRSKIVNKLSNEHFKILCVLHSKYFNHRYNEPCTCNKRILRKWILDLDNKLLAN